MCAARKAFVSASLAASILTSYCETVPVYEDENRLFLYVPNFARISAVASAVETAFVDAKAIFEPEASRAAGVEEEALIKLYLYPAVEP